MNSPVYFSNTLSPEPNSLFSDIGSEKGFLKNLYIEGKIIYPDQLQLGINNDFIIDKLGKIQPHKHIPIEVKSKTGWNGLLDELQMFLYPHMILFLISNKPPQYINSITPSYIREGRVNNIYNVEKGTFTKIQ